MNQKDIVTLNIAGVAFLHCAKFPAPVGALYLNIHHHSAIVLEIEENTVWVKMIKKSYPYRAWSLNRFGVHKQHLKVITAKFCSV